MIEIFNMPLLFASHGKAIRIPNFGSGKLPAFQSCGGTRGVAVSKLTKRLSTARIAGQAVLVRPQRGEFNACESLNTRDEYLASLI
jgi:hypothetical protein